MALLTQLSQHIYTYIAQDTLFTFCSPYIPLLILQDFCSCLEVTRPVVHVIFISASSALSFLSALICTGHSPIFVWHYFLVIHVLQIFLHNLKFNLTPFFVYFLSLIFLFIVIVGLGGVFRKKNQCLFFVFTQLQSCSKVSLISGLLVYSVILLLSIKQIFSEKLLKVNLKFPARLNIYEKNLFLIDQHPVLPQTPRNILVNIH